MPIYKVIQILKRFPSDWFLDADYDGELFIRKDYDTRPVWINDILDEIEQYLEDYRSPSELWGGGSNW